MFVAASAKCLSVLPESSYSSSILYWAQSVFWSRNVLEGNAKGKNRGYNSPELSPYKKERNLRTRNSWEQRSSARFWVTERKLSGSSQRYWGNQFQAQLWERQLMAQDGTIVIYICNETVSWVSMQLRFGKQE